MDKQLITGTQLIFMITMFLFGTSVIIPTGLEASHDSWVVIILATVYSIILASLYSSLLNYYPGKSIIEILPNIMGALLGKFFGLIFIFFAMHLTSLVLRNLSDFMTLFLPGTPISVFPLSYLLLATYGINKGLEVLARIISWFFAIAVGIIVFNVLSLFPEMNYLNLLPVFENGYKPILSGFISASGFPFGEIVIFLMIIPHLNEIEFKHKNITLVKAAFTFLLLYMIINLRNYTTFGILVNLFTYPSFVAIQYVSIANLLENLGPFFMLTFMITIFSKTVLTFYACVVGFSQWAGLKDYRVVSLPMTLIIATLSIAQFESVTENIDFATRIYPLYIFPISFILPLVLLVVAKIKRKEN